jgi:hypothetical protein
MNILLPVLNTLNNFKDWSGSGITISVPASHSVIGQISPVSTCHWSNFSSVHTSWDSGKSKTFVYHRRLQVTMAFQDHKRVPVSVFMVKICASEPLKRIIGRIYTVICRE